MAYTYRTAPYVLTGSLPTSRQFISMSHAFNDRLKAGLGDPNYRIHQFIFGLFRQIRNPSEPQFGGLALNYPSLNEYMKVYSHLDPDDGEWPTATAGDYEGVNLSNPVGAFVFGNPQVFGEADRLNDANPFLGGGSNALANWETGKYQRGGYDPNFGVAATPFSDAAQSYMVFSYPNYSFHNKGAAAYYPFPKVLGWCQTSTGQQYQNYQYKFTNLDTNQVVTYNGSCGSQGGGSDTDVAGVLELPFAYIVYKWNGSYDRYGRSEWIEGPYTGGGHISRKNTDLIQDVLIYQFLKDHRGADSQRTASCFPVNDDLSIPHAFNFEEYFTTQNQLAPSYANYNGGGLTAVYPLIGSWNGNSIPSGSESTNINVPSGFRVGAMLIEKNGVSASVQLQVNHGGVTELVTLDVEQSQIKTFPSGSTSYFVVSVPVQINFTGSNPLLRLTVNLLEDSKPNIWDAYALLRFGSNGFHPTEYRQSRTLWENYRNYGMCIGTAPTQETITINNNPVLESARKQIAQWVKVIGRNQLLGYELEDGKSVLYFNPYTLGNTNFDSFKHLYNASDTGSNGIITSPNTGSFTNEWIMDVCLKNYGGPMQESGPFNTSEFKPSVYGDYFGWLNRSHLFDPRITAFTNADMFAAGMMVSTDIQQLYRGRMYAPEYPSGYNYAQNTNLPYQYWDSNQRTDFYKSNQIYPEPAEVEECKFVDLNGSQVIKIKLDRRLQYDDDAPSSIAYDRSGWNLTNLQNQSRRTIENGIMQYLIANDGTQEGNIKIGDASTAINLYQESGDHHGACIPEFYFTKQIPRPYEDQSSEDLYEDHDSIIRSDDFLQMALYLKAMSSGYVDGTREANCDEGTEYVYSTAFDYTFENLCYDAFGGRWLNNFSLEVRPDEPYALGPLPNTKPYAYTFNQIAACVNLLNKVRVPLPFKMDCREARYTGSLSLAPTWTSFSDEEQDIPPCITDANTTALAEGVSGFNIDTLVFQGEWGNCCDPQSCGFNVSMNARWDGQCSTDGEQFVIEASKTVVEYRFSPVDPLAYNAMSTDLQQLYGLSTTGFFARYVDTYTNTNVSLTNVQEESIQCQLSTQPPNFITWDGTQGWKAEAGAGSFQNSTCRFFSNENGTIDPGNPGSSDYTFISRFFAGTLGADCSSGVSRFIAVNPTQNLEVIVTVPLV